MKTILLTCLITALSCLSYGQNLNEWFRQKKTQNRYLLEHLAAQRIYLNYIRNGYKICQAGLILEGSVKREELLGHRAFFASLEKLSPQLMKSPLLKEILNLQRSICSKVRDTQVNLGADTGLSAGQRRFAFRVSTSMLMESDRILDILSEILSDGRLQMDDSQRLDEIQKLRQELLHRMQYYERFTSDLSLMASAGRLQRGQLELERRAHGLKGAQR